MRILLPFIIVFTLLLSACEKDINLNLEGTPPQLVVNGWVTNIPANVPTPTYYTGITNTSGYIVKLTTTANYYASDNTPAVSGATVIITGSDNPSVNDTLTETPAGSGVYIGKNGQLGKSGVTYSLYVKYNGQVYTAQDNLDSMSQMGSVRIASNTGERVGYRITYYIHNIPGSHYYFFKYYRNDSLLNGVTNIYLSADSALLNPNETEYSQESPFLYQTGDSSHVEIYSLSKTMYTYYSQLRQQLSTSGSGGGFATVFTTVPANVHGNISNGAQGFFQASMYLKTNSIDTP